MTLIKSISGIRGTIGGHVTDGLNPVSTAQFTAAYASFIRQQTKKARPLIIVGRDARISGIMVNRIVTGTLLGMGCDVIDIGRLIPAGTGLTYHRSRRQQWQEAEQEASEIEATDE